MLQYTPLIYFTSRRESKSGAAKIVNMGEGPACSSTKPPLTCQCKSCVDPTQLAFTFLARRRTYKTSQHAQRYLIKRQIKIQFDLTSHHALLRQADVLATSRIIQSLTYNGCRIQLTGIQLLRKAIDQTICNKATTILGKALIVNNLAKLIVGNWKSPKAQQTAYRRVLNVSFSMREFVYVKLNFGGQTNLSAISTTELT